jgi:hypothetical protein
MGHTQTLEYHMPKSAKSDRSASEERLVVRRQLVADTLPTPVAEHTSTGAAKDAAARTHSHPPV